MAFIPDPVEIKVPAPTPVDWREQRRYRRKLRRLLIERLERIGR